ncbi:hypothetical protein D3C84_1117650 [compost metagenome]
MLAVGDQIRVREFAFEEYLRIIAARQQQLSAVIQRIGRSQIPLDLHIEFLFHQLRIVVILQRCLALRGEESDLDRS